MKMHKRIATLSICMAIIASGLTGCGQSNESIENTSAAETTIAAEITTTFRKKPAKTTAEEDEEEIIYDYDSAYSSKVVFDDDSYLSNEYESEAITENETEIQVDDSIYTHYELLSRAWDGAHECREKKDLKIYFDNDKIYIINTDPDGNVGTGDGYTWGSYDIKTKEYTTTYNAAEPVFKADSSIYVSIYDSWYYDNYFYAVYRCTSYEVNNYYQYHCVVKMDVNGNVEKRIMFDDDIHVAGIIDGKFIIEYHDDDDYKSTHYYVYSNDLEMLAYFTRPSIPLPHGLSEPAYVSDFFGYDGKIYAIANQHFYRMNIENNEWTEVNIIEEPTLGFGKYSIKANDGCITDVETGEIIYDGYLASYYSDEYFANTYFGGDYNIVLDDGVWYKGQYPYGACTTDFDNCETMGKESADYDDIFQLNETYYILVDKYGVFLRTYEKGETQEEVILMYK